MNPSLDTFRGDILIKDSQIFDIGASITVETADIFDASEYIITPGLIQTHVHLCQTLFRNMADDLSLLEWLKEKIWPLEASHTEATLKLSAQLGIAELIKGGSTTILDMGTVHHQDVIFEALAATGLRAFSGKAMMDYGELPASLKEKTQFSIDESIRLKNKWHQFDKGRLNYAFAPRFALSCSDELMIESAQICKENNLLYHTHAAENRGEVEQIKKRFGCGNIALFKKLGFADKNLCLAHGIWVDEDEIQLIKERDIKILHCPSANLKLGSGTAPIPKYMANNINVSIGSDGAPCNNNLDIFTELRLAALIQKPLHGAKAMPALEVFKLATINAAKCLALEDQIGSLERGKQADLCFIKMNQVHSIPFENIYSKLIYSAKASDVEYVMAAGKWLLKNKTLQTLNENRLIENINLITASH
jgi:5-methylthioadenosine/S-adenosylhomocysteine deaminase